MSEEHDLGHGYSYTTYTHESVEGSCGLLIVGPAGPDCPYRSHFDGGMCGGSVPFESDPGATASGRPRWKVVSLDPLTLTPSIKCKCGFQHGHIRRGCYVPG